MAELKFARIATFALAVVLSFQRPQNLLADDGPVRLGVLNDQSSSNSDVTGEGSVIAARLAIEDFGGSVLGRKIELLSGVTRTRPTLRRPPRDAGSTSTTCKPSWTEERRRRRWSFSRLQARNNESRCFPDPRHPI